MKKGKTGSVAMSDTERMPMSKEITAVQRERERERGQIQRARLDREEATKMRLEAIRMRHTAKIQQEACTLAIRVAMEMLETLAKQRAALRVTHV